MMRYLVPLRTKNFMVTNLVFRNLNFPTTNTPALDNQLTILKRILRSQKNAIGKSSEYQERCCKSDRVGSQKVEAQVLKTQKSLEFLDPSIRSSKSKIKTSKLFLRAGFSTYKIGNLKIFNELSC